MKLLHASMLASLAVSAGGAASVLPLEIELHARAVQPGEPIRIEVRSPLPLGTLEGDFGGEPVAFRRAGGGGSPERWSGWAMVGLLEEPGVTVLEVRGRTRAGQETAGTRAVTVHPKEFPTEQLSVAPRYVEPPPEARERLAREREKLAALYASRQTEALGATVFTRPVTGPPTSPFGTRRIFNGKPRDPHSGLDLRAATGTTVASAGDGVVGLAQDLYYSGKTVIVDHGGGLFTLYAHLSELQVGVGERVEAGQTVGLSGATGRVTGPHLHWGAKIGNRPFDPRALLDERLFPAELQ
jgi:murein DD-endopeptidase MepM/ murein hydrolase activator NlpD